ncbi:uncharacterized protein LOC123541323 [Mercenaria mercenaria]|uniref:uncharacterized protein LOC123541323 n=1 Tax=Mercenaria mercenaria TaxID=6596 RepID=UPI00234F8621|nr:uncharacterized protein LOC123541323 [Mercenaria mercenaria]
MERYGHKINLETVQKEQLNNYLKQFYAEAQPKITPDRKRKFQDTNLASEYHRNTMKNARAAINRHFRDISRSIDIVRDTVFQEANDILDAKLKSNLKAGLNLPTAHKPIIPPKDLQAIHSYLKANNPIALRYRAWFILSIQFVSRGLEFHPQLNRNSLQIHADEEGREYIHLTHDVKEKQNQSGITNEKRIYAIEGDSENCPVQNLKAFMAHCDPNAEKLFCHVNKLALEAPDVCQIWYNTKPVSTKQFTSFMGDISRNAGLDTRYTAHCLRATATQGLDDAGCEIRHIMFMTGHRNEASVRSYSRGTTTEQKMKMSKILTELSTGSRENSQLNSCAVPVPSSDGPNPTYENKKITMCQQDSGMGMFNPSSCTFSNCTFTLQSSLNTPN